MILIDRIVTLRSRSPCGERGLKWIGRQPFSLAHLVSLPVRGAWIEIKAVRPHEEAEGVAPRAGSVD